MLKMSTKQTGQTKTALAKSHKCTAVFGQILINILALFHHTSTVHKIVKIFLEFNELSHQ